ncbi:MAG: 4-hydroxy-tetrahydrodipicolinate reductase [Candidatus Diapherotrites archaeon CG11_big_fil_rev_8_21_14_0_20_37_9]|nr:MAG: 4-hydroxy-tetrahydrodipicolinate reductase [Candidatus Diapherotrites archaeon CG11_big_fil_rev_8_21_14_0_20_37_9]
MKIALIGYGKMGKMVEAKALDRGHKIVSIIDPKEEKATHREISEESLSGANVCIDFTHPLVVVENINKVSGFGKNIVVGTTGWYDQLDSVKEEIDLNKTGLIYASNFSVGMNILFKLTEYAAKIFDNFSDYDVAGIEYHHNKKADSPSGTAKSLAEIIQENIARKKRINYDKIDRKIEDDELHFASLRVGSVPGTHKILFDSNADTVELSHTARNREGFALGAVIAAEWINKKIGVYTINDLMNEVIK